MKQMIDILKRSILLWMMGVLASCATANREEVSVPAESPVETTTSHTRLEEQINADELSPEVLEAFELQAQTKLKDCYEFLQLISNPGYDTTFRKQAITQTLALFSNGSGLLQTGLDLAQVTLPLFLEELYQGKWGETRYQVSRIVLKVPLAMTSDTRYAGQIAYRLKLNDQYVSEGPFLQDIVVQKVSVDFGGEVSEIWKVFLGN